MHINKKNVSLDSIIDTAVQLIDENGGIKDVTLRNIAKKMECAHTNLYNYFDSLDEIYWQALGKVLLKMLDESAPDESMFMEPQERFILMLSNFMDFSLDHPGWYKLIWFETINGKPPATVLNILLKPNEKLVNALMNGSEKKITLERANVVCDILFRYLHGELCTWINHRSFINDRKKMKENAISNLKLLYELLMKEG